MRLLITGSSGFLGGSVGRFAAKQGHLVIGVARRSQADVDWPGSHVVADIAQTDLEDVVRQTRPDVIFHGAGTASVAGSFASPVDDLRAAALTWANVLDAVRRSDVRPRMIFPSSAAVYGDPKSLPVAEDASTGPISPYGYHKLAGELLSREYRECFGLDVTVCRIFSVFGPAQRRLLLWEMYEQARGEAPTLRLRGSGRESRDYLHADDLAAGILALAARPVGAGGHTFNLASGVETRIDELVKLLIHQTSTTKAVEWQNLEMAGNPSRWVADLTRTAEILPAWRPRSVADGVADCVRHWDTLPKFGSGVR